MTVTARSRSGCTVRSASQSVRARSAEYRQIEGRKPGLAKSAPPESSLCEGADRVRWVQTAALEAPFQVTPLDVAHGYEEDFLGRPSLVDRDDVRMVDRRGQLRLTQEAVTERFVLGEGGSQQFERNPPLEPEVLGQVDDAHAAQAQQLLAPVAGELGADPRVVAHVHVRILAFGSAGTIRRLGSTFKRTGVSVQFQARNHVSARMELSGTGVEPASGGLHGRAAGSGGEPLGPLFDPAQHPPLHYEGAWLHRQHADACDQRR